MTDTFKVAEAQADPRIPGGGGILAGNGQAPAAEIRVRFGPRPTQVIPLGWAETMLTELKRINPGLFGKLLVTASEGGR